MRPLRLTASRRGRLLLAALGLAVLALLGLAGWLAATAVSVRQELLAARSPLGSLRNHVAAGDVVAAERAVTSVQQHAQAAHDATTGLPWSVATHLPVWGDDARAVATVAAALDDLGQGVLPALVDGVDLVSSGRLRSGADRVDVAAVARIAPQVAQASARTKAVAASLDDIDVRAVASSLGAEVSDARGQVREVLPALDTAVDTLRVLPSMLGAGGTRRYFLAIQTPAEARGTGGLLGAYGIVEVKEGRLRIVRMGPATELRDPGTVPLDLGSDFAALYGADPGLWVNANLSPNFPYAARLWLEMWRRQHGERLDGVIATDPVALSSVLTALGPVRLPGGEEVTAGNVVDLTLRDVYARFPAPSQAAARDAYLQTVAAAVVGKAFSAQAAPHALVDAFGRAAGERRLLLFSRHATEQKILGRLPVGGVVPDAPGHFAGVVVNNVGGNKLDYYLRGSVTYRVGCGPEAPSRITVDLINTAPRTGLPAYVLGDHRRDGHNVARVSVYGPVRAILRTSTVDGRPLPLRINQERRHPVYTFRTDLAPGARRRFVLDLIEPRTAEGAIGLLKQPLAQILRVTTSPPKC